MSIGRIIVLILIYLIVLYFIFPSKPDAAFNFNAANSGYLSQDYNKQMFKDINFNSSRHTRTSYPLASGSSFSSNYNVQPSTINYTYNGYISTINTQIPAATGYQPTSISEQTYTNSTKRTTSNQSNDYSKIGDLKMLADVINSGDERTTAIFGNTDNNVAIGLQNSNNTIFHVSNTEDGGSNPEGDPLPLSDDLPIYLALIAIYFTAKTMRKKFNAFVSGTKKNC